MKERRRGKLENVQSKEEEEKASRQWTVNEEDGEIGGERKKMEKQKMWRGMK